MQPSAEDRCELSAVREQLLEVAEGLMRFRFQVASLAAGLEHPAGARLDRADEAEEALDERTELRSDLECVLVDCFDPLLRAVLAAGGGQRSKLLEAVLDLGEIKHRLARVSADLPRSPREDDMLDGVIEPDAPTEIRTAIYAVIVDQLELAIENLLDAAGYKPPEPGQGQAAGVGAISAAGTSLRL